MIEELKALAEKARELDRLDKVVFAHEVIALLPAILSALEAAPVMKEAVRNAYYEGYGDGACVGPIWDDANAGWEASGAHQALAAMEPKP